MTGRMLCLLSAIGVRVGLRRLWILEVKVQLKKLTNFLGPRGQEVLATSIPPSGSFSPPPPGTHRQPHPRTRNKGCGRQALDLMPGPYPTLC